MMKVQLYLALAFITMGVACEKLDTVESTYPDAEAAIKDGAIERGVIPAFLPPSAKDIYEKHSLDTNEVWLRFSMEPGERAFIEKLCQRIQPAQLSVPRVGAG